MQADVGRLFASSSSLGNTETVELETETTAHVLPTPHTRAALPARMDPASVWHRHPCQGRATFDGGATLPFAVNPHLAYFDTMTHRSPPWAYLRSVHPASMAVQNGLAFSHGANNGGFTINGMVAPGHYAPGHTPWFGAGNTTPTPAVHPLANTAANVNRHQPPGCSVTAVAVLQEGAGTCQGRAEEDGDGRGSPTTPRNVARGHTDATTDVPMVQVGQQHGHDLQIPRNPRNDDGSWQSWVYALPVFVCMHHRTLLWGN